MRDIEASLPDPYIAPTHTVEAVAKPDPPEDVEFITEDEFIVGVSMSFEPQY